MEAKVQQEAIQEKDARIIDGKNKIKEKMLIMNQVSTYELQDDDAVFVGHRSKNGEKPVIEETKNSKKEKKK